MFKDGVVLLVICLVLIGGIFAWWTHSPAHSLSAAFAPPGRETEPAAKKPPAAVAVAKHSKSKPVAVPDIPGDALIPEVKSRQESPEAVAHLQSPPPPFPAVDQIAPGLHEDSITGKYGNPSLSAVTSAGGHMLQTFVYARDGRVTIIRLQDGKAASVFSKSEPIVPPGLSAPRRVYNQ